VGLSVEGARQAGGATKGDTMRPTGANRLAVEPGGSPASPPARSLRQLHSFGGDQMLVNNQSCRVNS
jgi:hypothetical protein